jgi:hypothetical protein
VTVHDHPERTRAQARGDLAERLVPVAAELAGRVRDEDRQSLGEFLARYTRAERDALLIVVAAMVDVDRTPAELLAHVTFDEFGQLLNGTAPVLPRCSAEPDAEPESGNPLAWVEHAASAWFSDRPVTEESVRKAWEAQLRRAAERARQEAEWRRAQEQRAIESAGEDGSDPDDNDGYGEAPF